MKANTGDRLKLTRKSFRVYTDNLWKRGVTKYYFPLLAVTLNKEHTSVVTKVTREYMYQNRGCRYRLELAVIGFSVCFVWHSHHPKQERIKL